MSKFIELKIVDVYKIFNVEHIINIYVNKFNLDSSIIMINNHNEDKFFMLDMKYDDLKALLVSRELIIK